MFDSSALLLISAVAAVGVFHTVVPDHWVPITLIARQNGWSVAETAQASLQAGTGHVPSTLLIALVVWLAGVAAAERFGQVVDTAASVALIAFGSWVALSALLDLRRRGNRGGHTHRHGLGHGLDLLTPGAAGDRDGHEHAYWTDFAEHEQHAHAHHHADGGEGIYGSPDEDELYAPLAAGVALQHRHVHRHGRNAPAHAHWHDHKAADAHPTGQATVSDAPLHQHRHKTRGRTALLLILGSSPMVEGIPAFFAAGRYGIGFIVAMAIVFGVSTIGTYVLLCVYSTSGLQRVRLGPLERYGEVLSGAFIAGVGFAFWIWPAI
jgi:hypothetical protein